MDGQRQPPAALPPGKGIKIVSTDGDPLTVQDKISRNCPQVSNKITEGFYVNLSKWGTRFARISVRVDLKRVVVQGCL
jgi:hypothetical protein